MIENVVAFAAMHRKLRTTTSSSAETLKDLLVKGIISESVYDSVRDARRMHNALLHDPNVSEPARADILALMQLGLDLERAVLADEISAEPIRA